jgi:zinc transporter ZupT
LPLAHAALWLLTGLVALPALFAAALTGVATALTALLCLLAAPHLLLRRPTGLGAAVAAIWALPRSILPGYLAALRRVRRPRMWGAAAGFVAGVAAYAATHGFRPPPG